MQAAFMDNWMKSRGEVLQGQDYFPPLAPRGEHFARIFKSSSTEGSESVRLMYLLTITSAESTILLANSYFVPDDLSVDTLAAAAERGVRIEIIVPGTEIDTEITRKASRSRWGRLLEAGVQIHEFQPTMFHCKMMIVDGAWVSVGSTNFDSRLSPERRGQPQCLDEAFAARRNSERSHGRGCRGHGSWIAVFRPR